MTFVYPSMQRQPRDTSRSVVIVGGGASGVLLAAHLLRARRPVFA